VLYQLSYSHHAAANDSCGAETMIATLTMRAPTGFPGTPAYSAGRSAALSATTWTAIALALSTSGPGNGTNTDRR
jgi:hypothetical protein